MVLKSTYRCQEGGGKIPTPEAKRAETTTTSAAAASARSCFGRRLFGCWPIFAEKKKKKKKHQIGAIISSGPKRMAVSTTATTFIIYFPDRTRSERRSSGNNNDPFSIHWGVLLADTICIREPAVSLCCCC